MENYTKDTLKIIGSVLAGFAALIWVVATWAMSVDRRACENYEKATGRETKFEKLAPLTWDCFTPTADGKWLSTEALREITD